MNFKIFFLFCLLAIFNNLVYSEKCPVKKHVVCYWASWAIYRPNLGAHNINPNIMPRYCTHIVYAFAGLNIDGKIVSLDPTYDFKQTGGGYKEFMKLKEKNPCVKLILAIGGWGEGSEKYSLVSETEESRQKFTDSVLHYLIYYNFDGLDFDWEYPSQRGGLSSDKTNYAKLLKLLKSKLSPRNRTITAAIPANQYTLESGFNISILCNELDFISLMSYDMHSPDFTSIQSPLKSESYESNEHQTIDKIIKYLRINNCPANKIIMGIPAYGKTYTLKISKNNNLNESVSGLGKPGPYTRSSGMLGYNEICENQKDFSDWKIVHLKENAAVYATRKNLWISYDDPKTIAIKGKYVLDEGLGGLMFWSIDTDDFLGNCRKGNYPLLKAANLALKNKI